MTVPNHTERNEDIGEALRALDTGSTRNGFWEDTRAALTTAAQDNAEPGTVTPIGSRVIGARSDEASDGTAPSGDSTTTSNTRWPKSLKPWLAVAAAAAVLTIVGLAFVLRPAGDNTTHLDVANPDVTDPAITEAGPAEISGAEATPVAVDSLDSAVGAAISLGDGGAATSVDYTVAPEVTELPAGSRVVAGSVASDLSIIDWLLPGSAQRPCEASVGTYGSLPVMSSGHSLVDRLTMIGGSHSFVPASGDVGVLTDGCGDSAVLAEITPQGHFEILSSLQIPTDSRLLAFPAVWSHDESQVLLHSTDATGITSLLAYDIGSTGDQNVLAPAAISVLTDAEPRRVLAELDGGVRVVAAQGQIMVGDQVIGRYPAGESLGNVLAERSVDGTGVAVASQDQLTIAHADGGGATLGGSSALALEWSPTGQLLFSTDGEPSLQVYDPQSPFGTEFTAVAGVDEVSWFEIEASDNGTVLALSGFRASEPVAVFLRFEGDRRVPALDPEERLAILASPDQTIGDQPLSLRGMGVIETGMTVAQAQAAVGGTLVAVNTLDGCSHAVLAGDPSSPSFMVITYQPDGPNLPFLDGTIERIELEPNQATLSGIRIGSTEADVRAAYGDRLEVTPHKYTFDQGGEYFTFVPTDAADKNYRVIMETFDDRVTQIRSGLLPAVEFVEGCA